MSYLLHTMYRELSPACHVSWGISYIPCTVRYLLDTMYREVSPTYHVSWGVSYIPCIVSYLLHTMYREVSPTYHVSWGISYIPCIVRYLLHTMFITKNHALIHLWWKENLATHQKVSKSYSHDCRIRRKFIIF